MQLHKTALELFNQAVSNEALNRQRAREDIDFALELDQWPEGVESQRKQLGKPTLTSPMPAKYLRDIVNQARALRPSIRVKPVDSGADVGTSQIIEGLVRSIEYQSAAESIYDSALEQAVVGGVGYMRVSTDYAHDKSFDLELKLERVIDPFMVYGDPKAMGYDSSDWDDAFVLSVVPQTTLRRDYPGKPGFTSFGADVDTACDGDIVICEWFHRRYSLATILLLSNGVVVNEADFDAAFYEVQGISVVASRQTQQSKVMHYTLDGDAVLSEAIWPGKYIPIIPVYGIDYIARGKRVLKGAVSDAKDAQIMDNYWASTATELVANAPKVPWIAEENALVDAMSWAKSGRADVPYLFYRKGAQPPQRPGSDPAPAATLMAQASASSVVKAVMGADAPASVMSGSPGPAQKPRNALSSMANYHFVDNLTRAIRHVGRVLVDAIPAVYNNRSVLRILGDDGKDATVDMAKVAFDAGIYDVDVKAGESYATRREETRYALTELLRTYPEATPLVGPLLLDNLDIPGIEQVKAQLMDKAVPSVSGPSIDQQIQLRTLDNEALKLRVESERLRLDAEQQQFDQAMKLRELDLKAKQAVVDFAVDKEALAIKQQAQDLSEVKAGVDIATQYVKL